MQLLQLLFNEPVLGALFILGLALSIGFHEAAHAYTAYWLGDITPKMQKRLTLNPIAHLDPIGSLFILLVGIGWGRAVEFNPYNLKNPKRDTALIAVAGPLTNVVIALFSALVVALGVFNPVVNQFLVLFATLNIALAVFNMLPIDPLDGFKVLGGILPPYWAMRWYETRQYGFIVLLVLFITGSIERIITPVNSLLVQILF